MLTTQIKTEIDELADEINKINFGEILIEIKHNKVGMVTYKGQKQPKKVEIALTKILQTANI